MVENGEKFEALKWTWNASEKSGSRLHFKTVKNLLQKKAVLINCYAKTTESDLCLELELIDRKYNLLLFWESGGN